MPEPDPRTPHEDRPPVIQPMDVQAYATPGWDASPGPDQEIIVTAEAVDERPLLWPTFVTIVVAIGGALIVSGIVLAVAGAVSGGGAVFRGTEEFNKWLTAYVATDAGLAVLVLPGQLTFCRGGTDRGRFFSRKTGGSIGTAAREFRPLDVAPVSAGHAGGGLADVAVDVAIRSGAERPAADAGATLRNSTRPVRWPSCWC